ncbi:MAG: SDR family NAD(P)-dependent oxidoreductase [Streptomycetaceae bacterium]|nr:SDR family NAD(P)-dependent oxidoreductase [Streptomycetaceae bacterium]
MSGASAVVTGAASGFGLGLAAECAARGMRVALLDRDGERVRAEAANLAGEYGVDAFGMAVDVADDTAVRAAADAVRDRFARADLVVSNVGVQLFGAVERLTDAEWQWVLDVNVVGSARVARAFLPLLRETPGARLAFTASSGVLAPASRMAAYQASKFAVVGLAETLRLELHDEHVTVTVVFPSGMVSRHLETSEAAQPEHLHRSIAEPEDFAAMHASNPDLAASVIDPRQAAANVMAALLRGDRYAITHGDLTQAVDERHQAMRQAAVEARDAAKTA